MLLADFKHELRSDTAALKNTLPESILIQYNQEELEIVAYILKNTKCLETALNVANSFKTHKKPA